MVDEAAVEIFSSLATTTDETATAVAELGWSQNRSGSDGGGSSASSSGSSLSNGRGHCVAVRVNNDGFVHILVSNGSLVLVSIFLVHVHVWESRHDGTRTNQRSNGS